MLPPISDTEQFTSEGGPARPTEPRPHMFKRQWERATYLFGTISSRIGTKEKEKKKVFMHLLTERERGYGCLILIVKI